MLALFTALSNAMLASFPVVLLASFVWGVLSIALSPCHLAGIPLVMAFICGDRNASTSRAFRLSLVFGLAVLLTVLVLGALTASLGRIMGDVGLTGRIVVHGLMALIFLLVGLFFLGLFPLPSGFSPDQSRFRVGGKGSAFLLGLLFGVGVGPCTFAFMAPVLGVIMSTATSDFPRSLLISLVFAIGHAGLIVLAGTFAPVVKSFLKWDQKSRTSTFVKFVLGILFILVAGYFVLKIFKP